MLKRIITAIIALCIFVPVLVFSDTLALPIVMSACAIIGCYEMLCCTGQKKNIFISVPIYISAAAFPVFMRFSYLNFTVGDFNKIALGVIFVLIVYTLGVAVFYHKRLSVTDAAMIFTACIYIIAAFTSVVYIHDFIRHGKYIYLLVFLCAWMTDSFAYFTGRFLGKHKLIPDVSPKKTVEGAVGGVVFCVITTVVFGFVIEKFFNADGQITANYMVLALSGVLISVVTQVGDLIMSVIKRHYGIKDYGKIFPGHGGILDRFDSVLAASVILAFICTYFDLLASV